jgi:hypothetical protein
MNYMKKLMPLAAAAVMGLLGMKASALPNGYESATFHATLILQNSETPWEIKKISMSNKDLLNLIRTEFISTPIPSNAQLVSRGLDGEQFEILVGNTVLLSNVSTNTNSGDNYKLQFNAYADRWTESEVSNKNMFDYTSDLCILSYMSGDGSQSFTLEGTTTINDNLEFDNETFKMSNASGSFNLLIGGEGFGTMTGSFSGSGKDVECFGLF